MHAQAEILLALRGGRALTRAELARITGRKPRQTHTHLQALIQGGAITATRRRSGSVGNPELEYRMAPETQEIRFDVELPATEHYPDGVKVEIEIDDLPGEGRIHFGVTYPCGDNSMGGYFEVTPEGGVWSAVLDDSDENSALCLALVDEVPNYVTLAWMDDDEE